MSKDRAPAGLRSAGVELWNSVVAKYDLRVDEKRVLADACHATDRIADMREALAGASLLTTGSTGQVVVHPLVAEIRAHEAQVAALLAKLKLPDEAGEATESRSTQARAAAQSRWAAAHGKGA